MAVMCKPHRCPHVALTGECLVSSERELSASSRALSSPSPFLARLRLASGNICVYCPGGPDSDFEYSTQSYTGYEPTSMRAIRARYDPYEQAKGRMEQLKSLGHSVDKVRNDSPLVLALMYIKSRKATY